MSEAPGISPALQWIVIFQTILSKKIVFFFSLKYLHVNSIALNVSSKTYIDILWQWEAYENEKF